MSIHKAPTPVRSFGPKLDAHQIIVRPLVTEKSNQLTDELRTYMFEVNPLATKPEIKQAAEVLFNIKISSGRTMNVRGKTRGNRFKMGRLSHWKKAYVTLQPDSPALDLF